MACAKLLEENEAELSPEALALIEHIGVLLAEEYVQLLKESEEKQENESSNLC